MALHRTAASIGVHDDTIAAAPPQPWHEGERALQARAGVAGQMAALGPRVLRDHMPEQHRTFFAGLPFLVVGGLDAARQPWAGTLAGAPGFAHSPDPRQLVIDARPAPEDPIAAGLQPGAPLGLLGIEPHTRRRNRLNGVVSRFDDAGFALTVSQSFGNCPRYIQARVPVFTGAATLSQPGERLARLDAAARRLIAQADTFFIASAHPAAGPGEAARGVDVSHRGGRPGFVRLEGEARLTVPDFVGNGFFNTLGNLALEPRAGLLFIDFERGDLLQLAVTAQLVWDVPAAAAGEGVQRLLRMEVVAALRRPAALPLSWGPAMLSPWLDAMVDGPAGA